MQPVLFQLLRQSFRPPYGGFTKRTPRTTTTKTAATAATVFTNQLVQKRTAMTACVLCQFRGRFVVAGQQRLYSTEWGRDQPGLGAERKKSGQETGVESAAEAKTRASAQDAASSSQSESDLLRFAQTSETAGRTEDDSGKDNGNGNGNGNKRNLPSQMESRRSEMAKSVERMMDDLQSNIFIAGQRLNDLTGYSSIEKLKADISAQEKHMRDMHALVRTRKEEYTAAINRRSTSQREVNELLQRKHAWSPGDLERFTSLYRSDHTNERAEIDAAAALSAAERAAEEASTSLSRNILARYHEEQIWSDKIRRMSTWGTWGLMGVNVLLFLVLQIAVEPWRRKRLVRGFEDKVAEALERERGKDRDATAAAVAAQQVAAAETPAVHTSAETTPLGEPNEVVDSKPEPQSPVESADETLTQTTVQTTAQPEPQIESPTGSQPEPKKSEPPMILFVLSKYGAYLPVALRNLPDTIRRRAAPHLNSLTSAAGSLLSDRRVTLSQRDLTTIAAESAAAGAAMTGAVVGIVALVLRGR